MDDGRVACRSPASSQHRRRRHGSCPHPRRGAATDRRRQAPRSSASRQAEMWRHPPSHESVGETRARIYATDSGFRLAGPRFGETELCSHEPVEPRSIGFFDLFGAGSTKSVSSPSGAMKGQSGAKVRPAPAPDSTVAWTRVRDPIGELPPGDEHKVCLEPPLHISVAQMAGLRPPPKCSSHAYWPYRELMGLMA